MSFSFTLSPSAIRHVSALQAQGKPLLRVRITSGGCAGFQYQFTFEDTSEVDDLHVEEGGAHIIIDPISLPFIQNAQLDYVEELIGSYLTIRNPDAQGSCGCGSSFTP